MVGISKTFPVEPRYPRDGWVVYAPEELLKSAILAIRSAVDSAGIKPEEVVCLGLANQGETVIAFDRRNGKPVYPAISWQDQRNSTAIAEWSESPGARRIRKTTGLIPDTYFSASKVSWLLANISEARELAHGQRLCAATSDTWLI